MAIFALLAAKGGPGVSTAASALTYAWPSEGGRQVLLVDADVSGGGPMSDHQRYGLGDGRGLLGWAAGRGQDRSLEHQLLTLDARGRRQVLAGLPDAGGAPVLGPRWAEFVLALRELSRDRKLDVLVDLGRWGTRYEATPLLAAADVVVLVLRTSFESVTLTQALVRLLPRADHDQLVGALLVGERDPYSADEVIAALGVEVLAALPRDLRAARRLGASHGGNRGGTFGRSLRENSVMLQSRSGFARAAEAAAHRLCARAPVASGA